MTKRIAFGTEERTLIEITRCWHNALDDDDYSGWECWICVFPGGVNDGLPSDECFIALKKNAIAWAKKHHPGARINYSTNYTRRAALDAAEGRL
jgi:hypothetical protein